MQRCESVLFPNCWINRDCEQRSKESKLDGTHKQAVTFADIDLIHTHPQQISILINARLEAYLDPSYWGGEKDYGQDVFGRTDFDQFAAQLVGIKGKFLLSINDTPGVRETFAGFHMIEADTTYTAGAGAAVKAAELIISNFDLC